MAVAAFVISILAAVVAALSALYTKRQADAATDVATRDAQRHHEERRPRFDPSIEMVNEGQAHWYRLWLRLTTHEALSAVRVEIAEAEGVEFSTDQDGVAPRAPSPALHAMKVGGPGGVGMLPDERFGWRVLLSDHRSPEMRLKVHSVIGGEEWVTVEPVKVPIDPQAFIF